MVGVDGREGEGNEKNDVLYTCTNFYKEYNHYALQTYTNEKELP